MYSLNIKRFIDFIISLCVLPFIIILILLLAPAIYISDPGPIFYCGERLGKNGKIFKMIKFRTMYVNSKDLRNEDGSTFNSPDDCRVTYIGSILRKTSIDELPQIINVFYGDMSFVGPRPLIPTKPYEQMDSVIRKILSVRPGITGFCQAYYRNSITQAKKFEYDSKYVDNLCFILDLKIILKTFMTVIKRSNIYISE